MSTHVTFARNPLPRAVNGSRLAGAWLFLVNVTLGIVADDARAEAARVFVAGRISPQARRAAAKARRAFTDASAVSRVDKCIAALAAASIQLHVDGGTTNVESPKAARATTRRERREAREAREAELRLANAAANAKAREIARSQGATIAPDSLNTSVDVAPRTARASMVVNFGFTCLARKESACAAPFGYDAAPHFAVARFSTSPVTRISARELACAVLNGRVYFPRSA